jgi:hyperosmotically inducible periplasmic protein
MNTRALSLFTAVGLGVLMLPLAGCDRDISAIHAEKDAQGNTHIRVEKDKIDQNAEKAKEDLKAAGEQVGEQVKDGAQQVGHALQRGAKKFEAEVEPVAKAVLDDAGITARVKAKLLADPEVGGIYIDVDTLEGRVTLNGKVKSQDEKAEAEKLARHTDGVRSVVNLIQVAGQPVPAAPVPPAGSHR